MGHNTLPWQGLGHLDYSGHDIVAKNKEQISSHELCHGLPVKFSSFLDYSRLLSFDAKPNYHYLFDLFDNLLLQEGLNGDLTFDWDVVKGGQLGGRTRCELHDFHDFSCQGQCSSKHHIG